MYERYSIRHIFHRRVLSYTAKRAFLLLAHQLIFLPNVKFRDFLFGFELGFFWLFFFILFFPINFLRICPFRRRTRDESKFSSVILFRVVIGSDDNSVGKLASRQRLLRFATIGGRGKLDVNFPHPGNAHALDRTGNFQTSHGAWAR